MRKKSSASSAFEAQQNVPFPIDEVVWDYQLVGGGTEEQIQVVLVAIKADLLEGINAAVESAGLEPLLVDVATMALYNAFRYNYSELSGCSLLVDIGARTTNLLFIEPGKIFSRSIPIGGNADFLGDREGNRANRWRRRSFGRSAKDSLVWAAHMRNRPIPMSRACRKLCAAQ